MDISRDESEDPEIDRMSAFAGVSSDSKRALLREQKTCHSREEAEDHGSLAIAGRGRESSLPSFARKSARLLLQFRDPVGGHARNDFFKRETFLSYFIRRRWWF